MKKILFFTVIVSFISSCTKKNEEQPPPVNACFSPSKVKVIPGESISFSNCSSGSAHHYSWDFGDGTSSTESSPVKSYNKTGSFGVSMTAFSSDNSVKSTSSYTIQVGQRYLTKIVIKQLPSVKNAGNDPWDIGSASDLKFYIGKASNTAGYDYQTNEASDAILPYEWDLTSQNILLTNETWKFRITDVDATAEEEIGINPAFNPTTQGNNGVISFSSTNSHTEIKYDFR